MNTPFMDRLMAGAREAIASRDLPICTKMVEIAEGNPLAQQFYPGEVAAAVWLLFWHGGMHAASSRRNVLEKILWMSPFPIGVQVRIQLAVEDFRPNRREGGGSLLDLLGIAYLEATRREEAVLA